MAAIKNVAIVWLGGRPGQSLCCTLAHLHTPLDLSEGQCSINALVKSGKSPVTVVKRPSSYVSFPNLVTIRTADLSSVDSVTAAFEGQDAVLSTVGTASPLGQGVPLEAAVAANVKRIFPSGFWQ